MEEAVAEKEKISMEVEQMRKELNEAKELKKNLEKEASELMGKVSSLSIKSEEVRTMSKTAKQVSKLMQEGRLAGVEQELLDGRFRL